jgi:hypothetical protein
LYVLAWIIFVGVCIEACGFIFNTLYVLFINSAGAKSFWEGMDLSDLYKWDRGYFFVETSLMCIVAIMRAIMFSLIVKNLHGKNLDMSQPFNNKVRRFILLVAYLSLGIGIFSRMGVGYAELFVRQGVKMPDTQYLRLGGADVWLFMSVTLFVIAQIFKRGIEIQTENELTV